MYADKRVFALLWEIAVAETNDLHHTTKTAKNQKGAIT